MNEGPTTVATINAKITADADQTFRTFEEVKADAKALGAIDPDIKVKTSGADAAMAKLAAVAAAEDKYRVALQRVDIAYERLQETEKRGTAQTSTKLAAQLALERAEKSEKTALQELTAAKLANVTATEAQIAASDSEAASVAKVNEANKTNVNRIGLILTLVAALIPLIAPLAGYSLAVAGGFSAMGAAGILAIVGIRNEMTKGTLLGQSYSAGMRVLKDDLNALGHTAAVAMLNDYQQAVGQINAAMPFLNTSTRTFTDILGNTGNRVLSGVISALRVLNPLFVTGAVYVNQLAAGFQHWTQDGGLQKFADYAQTALPRVADTLGAVAGAVLHIVEATAPLGTVTLGVLTAVSNVIEGIPSDALVTLAAAATGGFIAFKAWGLIAPLLSSVATAVGAVGVATEIATGPIGWVAAGVTALAAVMAVAVGSTNAGADAVSNYTAAVQADTGAIKDNVKAAAAKALYDSGAYAAAEKLGISTRMVTAAVLGNGDAMRILKDKMQIGEAGSARLKSQMDSTGLGMYDLASASLDLQYAVTNQSEGLKSAITGYQTINEAISDTTTNTQGQLDAANALARTYGTSVGAYQNAVDAQQSTADQLAATTLQMRLQNDASGLLANALTILNGGSLSVAQAQTGLASANNGVVDSFWQNGKAIDGNTKAAVANQQAIQQQVAAAQAAAEAIGQQTGSTEKAVQSYKDSKDALEAQLSSQGLLTDSVQTYIDKLYDVSNLKVPPTQLDVDNAAALVKVQQLIDALGSIPAAAKVGLNVTANGQLTYSDAQNSHYAQGHAGGGTITGIGTSTSDSNVRRLSTGEEVIRASSAMQVRPLLKAINANPAAAVAAMAASVSRAQTSTTNHWSIVTPDPIAAANEIERRRVWKAA